MIVLLGASGYVGSAFAAALRERGWAFAPLTRTEVDYTSFEVLLGYLRRTTPSFLINAAGYTGVPNVDACETARAETLAGNTLFPQTIAHACLVAGVPWGHVSSGCIFSGAKLCVDGQLRVEKDLMLPELRAFLTKERAAVRGYTELDPPNFSFRAPPCSFYSGAKALGEEAIAGVGQSYVWRLRIPFDELDHSRNYLTKIQRYARVYDNANSLSHRGDFTRACLDLWERRAPFGTYNVTNPGFVTARQVIERIREVLRPDRSFTFWENDEEFYLSAPKRRDRIASWTLARLLAAGVRLRPVEEAVEDALRRWRSA